MRDFLRFSLFAIPMIVMAILVGALMAPVVAETLEPVAGVLVDTIAEAGKGLVDRPLATTIVGVFAILLYRAIAALAARAKTPVGKPVYRAVATMLGVILGSEAKWRNRVLAKGTDSVEAFREKTSLLARLARLNPLVKNEIAGAQSKLLR